MAPTANPDWAVVFVDFHPTIQPPATTPRGQHQIPPSPSRKKQKKSQSNAPPPRRCRPLTPTLPCLPTSFRISLSSWCVGVSAGTSTPSLILSFLPLLPYPSSSARQHHLSQHPLGVSVTKKSEFGRMKSYCMPRVIDYGTLLAWYLTHDLGVSSAVVAS